MNFAYQRPTLRRILPDAAAFVLGLATAWVLQWKTTDLVWSLWLCSLVLGYLTILSTLVSGAYLGIRIAFKEGVTHRLAAILIGSAAGLFLLGFFSLHFCGFHAGHAGFLSAFFPLEGVPKDAFFDAFTNPILLWKTVFRYLMPVYGVFLIPAIIAERQYVFASLIGVSHKNVAGKAAKALGQRPTQTGTAKTKSMRDNAFTRPYINVIRMHILIFFFGFCHVLKIDSFFVYAVVYFVYFFPWTAFTKNSG